MNKISFLKPIFLTGFKKLILGIIRTYQNFISPSLAKNCRFHPSCSDYSCQAIEKYGLAEGLWLSVKRILRCHPWNSGGIDHP